MKSYRVLVGLLSEEDYSDGSTALNNIIVSGLKEVVDLSLVVTGYWGRQRPGPLVEETFHHGLPALVIRPRTRLAFDLTDNAVLTDGVAEGQYLAQCIANYASKQQVDLMHVLQWGHLKGCLFEAALRARIPFVHTPYEYWSVCPAYFLLQYGRTICSGPDESGRKCRNCVSNLEHLPRRQPQPLPYARPTKTFMQKLPERLTWRLQSFAESELAMKMFGPQWEPLFGPAFGRQQEIASHLRALRFYLARAARILPMNTFWARELSKHLRIPFDKFTVCPPGVEMTRKIPKGDRFKPPLHFGHPHRVSRESGTFVVLDAWRKSAVTPDHGILHIYGQDGSQDLLRTTGYEDLIRSGSVKVHEGRIADKLDEVFQPLAAVVSAYSWKIGSCGNTDAIARGVPNIAGHWDYPEYEKDTPVRDGLNALTYRRWDVDSLADVFRNCARDPAQLERLYDTCELPSGFTRKDFIERYHRVYKEILAEKRAML
jgi:glycosyltransferase involved in cell wall biosynthesis